MSTGGYISTRGGAIKPYEMKKKIGETEMGKLEQKETLQHGMQSSIGKSRK